MFAKSVPLDVAVTVANAVAGSRRTVNAASISALLSPVSVIDGLLMPAYDAVTAVPSPVTPFAEKMTSVPISSELPGNVTTTFCVAPLAAARRQSDPRFETDACVRLAMFVSAVPFHVTPDGMPPGEYDVP